VPPNEALVRTVRTTKNGLAGAGVGVAGVLTVQPMNDRGNQRDVEGARRKPKKSPKKRRSRRVQQR